MNDNHCIFGGAVLFLLIPGLSMISWEQEDGMRIRRVDYRRCYVCTGSRRHVSSRMEDIHFILLLPDCMFKEGLFYIFHRAALVNEQYHIQYSKRT